MLLGAAAANAQAGSLNEIARRLESEPVSALSDLQRADISPLGLPCNDLLCRDKRLNAASLDILLQALARTWRNRPAYRAKIERIVLRWNFCQVNLNNAPHDLKATGGGISAAPSPRQASRWEGFRIWGFTPQDPKHRIIPVLLTDNHLFPDAKSRLLFRITRKQCFPDPLTGKTPYDPATPIYSLEYRLRPQPLYSGIAAFTPELSRPVRNAPASKPKETPHETKTLQPATSKLASSLPPSRRSVHRTMPHAPKNRTHLAASRKPKPAHVASATPPIAHSPPPHHQPNHRPTIAPSNPAAPARPATPVATWQSGPKPAPPQNTPAKKTAAPAPFEIGAPLSRSGIVFAQPAPWQPLSLKNGGDIYERLRLRDSAWLTGIRAQWNPYRFFYLRAGIEVNTGRPKQPPAWTWGLGYNDWRPGGFSIELNQWQPVSVNQPLRLNQATLSIGHHLNLQEPWNLSGRLTARLSLEISGGKPKAGGLLQYDIGGGWFCRTGLSYLLSKHRPRGWNWVYGIGRWSWKHNSINFEYANWGYNPAFQGNYRKNGEFILSWHWFLD